MAKIYLNEEWKFTEEFTEQLTQTEYDESKLEVVRLPHTCKVLPYNYFLYQNFGKANPSFSLVKVQRMKQHYM